MEQPIRASYAHEDLGAPATDDPQDRDEGEALGPDPMDDPEYVKFCEEEEARGELAGAPREMLCYACRPGEGLLRPVVKLGPVIDRADPTQSFVLGCGHTAI